MITSSQERGLMNASRVSGLCLVLALKATPVAAAEDDTGFYVGIGQGHSDFTGQPHEHFPYLPGQRPVGRPDIEEIHFGYQHTERLAFEIAHARSDAEGVYRLYDLQTGIIFDPVAPIQHEWIEFERLAVGMSLSHAFSDHLELIGQIGFTFSEVQETWSNRYEFTHSHAWTVVEDFDANGIYYGLGARLHLPGGFALRWLWTTEDAAIFDLKMSRVSLEYRF